MDRYVVPIVAIQYLFAFIDRANIGELRISLKVCERAARRC